MCTCSRQSGTKEVYGTGQRTKRRRGWGKKGSPAKVARGEGRRDRGSERPKGVDMSLIGGDTFVVVARAKSVFDGGAGPGASAPREGGTEGFIFAGPVPEWRTPSPHDVLFISKPYPFCASSLFLNFQ